MKRSLIALSVAAAALAPAAEAAPKVYGKLNLSVENFTDSNDPAYATVGGIGAQSTSRVVSNASRFGVKGEDELTAELSAIYQIEWQVAGDSADTGYNNSNATNCTAPTPSKPCKPELTQNKTNFDLTARNRFVGLKHATYGAVKIGQFDSYLKLAEGENDLFNDLYGDMKAVVAGQTRLKNVIGYESPKIAGFGFNAMYQTNDANNADVPVSSTAAGTAGAKGGKSASLTYNNEDLGLYAALAVDRGVSSKGAVYTTKSGIATAGKIGYGGTSGNGSTEAQRNNERAVIGYKVGDLFLGAVYTRSQLTPEAADIAAVNGSSTHVLGDREREAGYSLSSAYKLDDHTFKLQYGKGESKESTSKAEVRTVSAGYDYNFTSKTKAFTYYTKLDAKDAKGDRQADQRVFGVGIEHKF